MYIVKNGDATQLLTNFREADASSIKSLSDEKVTETLFLIKSLKDYIDTYEKAFKEEALSRQLTAIDEKRDLKILIEKGKSSTEINVDAVFKALSYDDFIQLVNVVQSRATTDAQKEAIKNASTKIESTTSILSIRTLSKEDRAKLKS